MTRIFAVALILISVKGLRCLPAQIFQMSRVPALENITIPGIIDQELETESLIECAIACKMSRNCETMRFNSTKSTCVIIGHETQHVSYVGSDLGKAFKHKEISASNKSALDGYQYIWELNVFANFYFDKKIMYFECKTKCEDGGAHLITFEYAVKEVFIHPYLMGIRGGQGFGFQWWIGLTDVEEEGNFTWLTGESLTAYKNWNSNEPDNKGPGDITPANCAYIVFNKRHDVFSWHDKSCNSTVRGCICERESLL